MHRGGGLVAADDPKNRRPRRLARPPIAKPSEVAEALQESWPDHPEWVDMLTGILEDEPMGPDFGWFRTAMTQTRFDWDATASGSTATATAGCRGRNSPAATPTSPASTATTTVP